MAKYSNLGMLANSRAKLVDRKNSAIKELERHKPRTHEDRRRLGKAVIKKRREIARITKEMYCLIRKHKAVGDWEEVLDV